jgi:uncharacterized protein (DUF2235 family)
MERNLALFFDGTWNERESGADAARNTNVLRMYSAMRPIHAGREQKAKYIEGVGTNWYDRISGGAFGYGLDRNICAGYRWLVENYRPGDRVYVFGFSRGAYTARSLIGMIRNAGLLVKVDRVARGGRIRVPLEALPAENRGEALDDMVERAYELYRDRGDAMRPKGEIAAQFRADYSTEIGVRCLGVWDTVGALGIPLGAFEHLNDERYRFHDTKLTRIVENAFHAVALDEHREPYQATLWEPADADHVGQRIEQAWFPGAHADVGGGYADDRRLADLALHWMQERAEEVGLGLAPVELGAPAVTMAMQARIHDSYSDFLGGVWATLRPERHYRTVGHSVDGPQTLDASVLARVDGGSDAQGRPYAPRNVGFKELFAAYRQDERAAA